MVGERQGQLYVSPATQHINLCQTGGIRQAALPLGKKRRLGSQDLLVLLCAVCRGVGDRLGMRLTRCILANPRQSAPAWKGSLAAQVWHGRGWRRFGPLCRGHRDQEVRFLSRLASSDSAARRR